MFKGMAGDVRTTWRRLRRAPAFCLTFVLTLTLAVGANVTLFSLMNALVLRPLPVRDAHRLVLITLVDDRDQKSSIPLATRDELAKAMVSVSDLSAYSTGGMFVADVDGALLQTPLEAADASYFSALGVQPRLGRLIEPADVAQPESPAHVVVLGYGFWQRAFSADSGVIGRALRVEGVALEIVGVLPKEYGGMGIEVAPDIAVPITLVPELLGSPRDPKRPMRSNYVVGKLRPGGSLAEVVREFDAKWPTIRRATVPTGYSQSEQASYETLSLRAASAANGLSALRPRYVTALSFLLGLAALLLVVACANLVGLLLIRLLWRQHEFSTMLALGASAGRMVRQSVIETMILSVPGVAGAVAVAWVASKQMAQAMWTGSVPLNLTVTPDYRVVFATIGLVTAIALVTAAVPARIVYRRTRVSLLSARSVTRRSPRIGTALVVVQVALSLTLVFGAGLFARSLARLAAVDIGFATDHVIVGRLQTQPGANSTMNRSAYSRELLERVRSTPEARAAALCHLFPAATSAPPLVAASASVSGGTAAIFDQVSPDFFRTIAVPLVSGRDFNWSDDERAEAVAIISADLAKLLFGEGEPLGRTIRIGSSPAERASRIVGVVREFRVGSVRNRPLPTVFRPLLQEPRAQPIPVLLVRTSAADWTPIRRAVESLRLEYAPTLTTLEQQVRQFTLQERMLARLSVAMAGVAALLAFLALFTIIAQGAARRTPEIGLRIALGAPRPRIAWLVARQGLAVTMVGVAAGLPLALGAGQLARSSLFGMSPFDTPTMAGSVAAFVLIAAAAGWLPAHRATRVSPVEALRAD